MYIFILGYPVTTRMAVPCLCDQGFQVKPLFATITGVTQCISTAWMSRWKLESMVNEWLISPSYNWGILG